MKINFTCEREWRLNNIAYDYRTKRSRTGKGTCAGNTPRIQRQQVQDGNRFAAKLQNHPELDKRGSLPFREALSRLEGLQTASGTAQESSVFYPKVLVESPAPSKLQGINNIHYRTYVVGARRAVTLGTLALFFVFVYFLEVKEVFCSSTVINLDVIARMESSGNPKAINKKDHGGIGSRGLYQISDGLRRDYNRLNKTKVTPDDLLSKEINSRIAVWAFNYYYPLILTKTLKKPITTRNLLVCHNIGCGALRNKDIEQNDGPYRLKYKAFGGSL